MTALVRASSLQGFEGLASALGLDGRQALRRFGLAAPGTADPGALVSYAAVVGLFEHSAREAGCPDFGLQLAARQGLGILGPVLGLIRHAPTIGDALQLASHHLFVHSPAARLRVQPVGSDAGLLDLCFEIDIAGRPACAQAYELSLSLLAQGLAVFGEGQVRPCLVTLPHLRLGASSAYARAFGCECSFGAGQAALRIEQSALALPLSEQNPQLQQLTRDLAQHRFARSGAATSLAEQVRVLVRQGLGAGDCSRKGIALALGLHPRTLQRRLEAQGQRFDVLLDDVRQEMLLSLMSRHAALPLGQIAAMLGYSEQSVLSRSCQRWFGCSPRELQRRRAPAIRL